MLLKVPSVRDRWRDLDVTSPSKMRAEKQNVVPLLSHKSNEINK